jgi:hypothetical protein
MLFSESDTRRRFLPNGQLDRIATPETVRRQLEAQPQCSRKVDQLIPAIFTPPGRQKLISVLALIEQIPKFQRLVEANLWDSDLPFQLRRSSDNEDVPSNDYQKLAVFRGWSQFVIDSFEDWQWAFLAPFFDPVVRDSVTQYRLHESTVNRNWVL